MQAKASVEPPHGWIVLPLLRSKVITGIFGWIFGILLGMGLFTGLAFIVIPYNYVHGAGPALFSSVLLGILLFIGLGSVWALYNDIRRLTQIDKHIIVITPEAFVQQEGEKVVHVPLMYVRNVTARGAPPPDRSASSTQLDTRSHASDNVIGLIAGRGFTSSGLRYRSKRMRTPTTLAFVDSRTDNEITIATDSSYGDPFMIAALLKQYAAQVQSIV